MLSAWCFYLKGLTSAIDYLANRKFKVTESLKKLLLELKKILC